MKRLQIICLFIFLVCSITAEHYCPLLEYGKKWTCSLFLCNIVDPLEGEKCFLDVLVLEQKNDTIVNGQTYTIISSNNQTMALLREDYELQSIYIIPVSHHPEKLYKKEFLFYKFNVSEGDTLVLYNNKDAFVYDNTFDPSLLTSNYIVNKIYTIDNRKVIELQSDDEYATINHANEVWLEGVGSMAGLLYRSSSTNELYTPWGIFDLLCVTFNEELIYQTDIVNDICQGSFRGKTISPQSTCGCETTPVFLGKLEDHIYKFIKNNQLFICVPNGNRYNILGQIIPKQ